MTTASFRALVQAVLNKSESTTWDTAVLEWQVVDLEEDPAGEGECICGQPHLVQMFTIRNLRNGESLYPIGNVCVRKFGRQDLDLEVNIFSKMHALRKAINAGEVEFTSEYFTRSLLEHLYSAGAFTPDECNHHDSEEDYSFLLDMFNKKNKEAITVRQQRKINVLLNRKVFPFVLAAT